MDSAVFRVEKEQRENRDTKARREKEASAVYLESKETEGLRALLGQEETAVCRVCLALMVTAALKDQWERKGKGDFLGHLEFRARLGSACRDQRVTSVSRGNQGLQGLREWESPGRRGLKGHRGCKEREGPQEKVSRDLKGNAA